MEKDGKKGTGKKLKGLFKKKEPPVVLSQDTGEIAVSAENATVEPPTYEDQQDVVALTVAVQAELDGREKRDQDLAKSELLARSLAASEITAKLEAGEVAVGVVLDDQTVSSEIAQEGEVSPNSGRHQNLGGAPNNQASRHSGRRAVRNFTDDDETPSAEKPVRNPTDYGYLAYSKDNTVKHSEDGKLSEDNLDDDKSLRSLHSSDSSSLQPPSTYVSDEKSINDEVVNALKPKKPDVVYPSEDEINNVSKEDAKAFEEAFEGPLHSNVATGMPVENEPSGLVIEVPNEVNYDLSSVGFSVTSQEADNQELEDIATAIDASLNDVNVEQRDLLAQVVEPSTTGQPTENVILNSPTQEEQQEVAASQGNSDPNLRQGSGRTPRNLTDDGGDTPDYKNKSAQPSRIDSTAAVQSRKYKDDVNETRALNKEARNPTDYGSLAYSTDDEIHGQEDTSSIVSPRSSSVFGNLTDYNSTQLTQTELELQKQKVALEIKEIGSDTRQMLDNKDTIKSYSLPPPTIINDESRGSDTADDEIIKIDNTNPQDELGSLSSWSTLEPPPSNHSKRSIDEFEFLVNLKPTFTDEESLYPTEDQINDILSGNKTNKKDSDQSIEPEGGGKPRAKPTVGSGKFSSDPRNNGNPKDRDTGGRG